MVRDITGHAPNIRTTEGGVAGEAIGALSFDYTTAWPNTTKELSGTYYDGLHFSASNVVPTSIDNHPYSIYLVPLITY